MNGARVPGRFADGQNATIRHVEVALAENTLTVVYGNAVWAAWPLGEVRLIAGPDRDGAVQLCRVGGAARLTIGDPKFLEWLRVLCPNLSESPYAIGVSGKRLAVWTAVALASVALFLLVGVKLLAREVAQLMPVAVETRVGALLSDEVISALVDDNIRKQGKAVCEAADGAMALDRLTTRLAASASLPFPVLVRVLNTKHVNAFALPGGRIFIFRGLIDAAGNAEAVAGVLAHELAHVEFRHPFQSAIEMAGVGIVVGLALGDAIGVSVGAIVLNMVVSGFYSRDMESEADDRAGTLLTLAGLPSAPLAVFFEALAAQHGDSSGLFSAISTHPGLNERAAAMRLRSLGEKPALSAAEWNALRQVCG